MDPRASTPATQRRLMWSGAGAGLSSSPHHINRRPYPRHRPPPQPRSRSGGGPETLARELRQEEAQPWIHETRATPWKGHQQQQLWSGLIPGHGHGHGGLPWKVSPALQLPDASCVQAYKEGRPPQEASFSSLLL